MSLHLRLSRFYRDQLKCAFEEERLTDEHPEKFGSCLVCRDIVFPMRAGSSMAEFVPEEFSEKWFIAKFCRPCIVE